MFYSFTFGRDSDRDRDGYPYGQYREDLLVRGVVRVLSRVEGTARGVHPSTWVSSWSTYVTDTVLTGPQVSLGTDRSTLSVSGKVWYGTDRGFPVGGQGPTDVPSVTTTTLVD